MGKKIDHYKKCPDCGKIMDWHRLSEFPRDLGKEYISGLSCCKNCGKVIYQREKIDARSKKAIEELF